MLGSAIFRPSSRTTHSCVRQRARRYRGLPASASFSSSSSRSTLKGRHWKTTESRYERPGILVENKCAKVRSWDLLRGPAEALVLVRAIEQKYGPVESIHFQEDFDNPHLYQTYVRINFRDMESFLRVPETTETIHLRAPRVQAKRPGGIGLDEILPLISGDPEFLTAEQVSEMSPEDRTIDFRIHRSASASFRMSPYSRGFQSKLSLTGFEMLKWGGFHEMKPIDSILPITNKDITEETLDHVHMRATLRDWARYLRERNPYEVYPEEQTTAEEQEQESLSSLPEMDGNVEESLSKSELPSASVPDLTRDALEEIFKDVDSTGAKTEPVVATGDATEIPQSASTPSPTIDLTAPSNELEHKQESLSTTAPDTQATSLSDSSTAQVEAQEQKPKQPNRQVDESTKAQLMEAKRLRELATSAGKPKEKQNAKTKSKNKGKKQKGRVKLDTKKGPPKQDAEPQTALGKLFSKVQDLFRGS